VSANSPIDRVIGVGWVLSPHASSYDLLTASEKTAKYTLFWSKCVLESLGNLEIIPADLLDTLVCYSLEW